MSDQPIYDWDVAGDQLGSTPWDGKYHWEIDHEARLAWCLERPAYRELIRGFLLCANGGGADYVHPAGVKYVGYLKPPVFELVHVGNEPEPHPYVMQGGFLVTSNPVFRSRLTDRGRALLRSLGDDG